MDIEMNSCSTMHKIQEKEFTLEDFSTDKLSVIIGEDIQLLEDYKDYNVDEYYRYRVEIRDTITDLNFMRRLYLAADEKLKRKDLTDAERKHVTNQRKKFWWQMIQLLPSSYNQTRNVMMNYEVLANIYKSRKNHKLDEWCELCKWIETLPYSELITGSESLKNNIEKALGNGATPNVDIDDIKALAFVPNAAREAVGLKPVIVSKEN